MGDHLKNLKFFRNAGVNEWVMCNEQFQDFFTWFSKNITEENILKDIEIREYSDILTEKTCLDKNELETELRVLSEEYPNILHNTDRDVSCLERTLEELISVEEIYENLTNDIKITELNIVKDLVTIESNFTKAENAEQNIIKTCLEDANLLEELQGNNQKQLMESNKCYSKPLVPPLFIYQMPFEQYYKKCDTFSKSLEVYMQNNFKIQYFLEFDVEDETTSTQMILDLEDVKERLYRTELNLIKNKQNTNGQKALLETIVNNRWQPRSVEALSQKVNELDKRNSQFHCIQIETKFNQLQNIIQQYADQEAEFIIYENNREKLQRATHRFDYLKKIANIVSNGLMNSEIVWILMQFDLEKVKRRTTCDMTMDKYNLESRMCLRRIEIMDAITNNPYQPPTDTIFLQELASLLSNHMDISTNKLDSLTTCFQSYEKLVRNLNTSLVDMVEKKNSNNMMGVINEMQLIEQQLNFFVKDGPVNKPNLWNLKFVEQMFNRSKELAQMNTKLKEIRCDYIQNYRQRAHSDKLWFQKQLLWIWFLTEPKKLLKVIKDISGKAKNISAKSMMMPKSISGIKRKQ